MNKFEEIIKLLTLNGDQVIIDIRRKLLAATDNELRLLINELKGKLRETICDVRLCEEAPFLEIFLAHSYNMLLSPHDAEKYVCHAIGKFKYLGNEYNAALAHWYMGLLCELKGCPDICRAELKESARLLYKIQRDYALNGHYLAKDKICELADKIKKEFDAAGLMPFQIQPEVKIKKEEHIKDKDNPKTDIIPQIGPSVSLMQVFPINVDSHNVFSPTFSPTMQQFNGVSAGVPRIKPIVRRTITPIDQTTPLPPTDNEDLVELPWISVYESVVQAGTGPGPEFEEMPQQDGVDINSVVIGDQIYYLESVIPGKHKIRMARMRKYGLVPVSGESMNAFVPPINECDYVLFYRSDDIEPNLGKVVIAWQRKEKGYSYLVKKLERQQSGRGAFIEYVLVSYTNKMGRNYEPLPLGDDYGILGVVVAVAKSTG